MYVCVLTTQVLDACKGQKRVSYPLELELQMIISCHVGSGNFPGSSGKAESVLNH